MRIRCTVETVHALLVVIALVAPLYLAAATVRGSGSEEFYSQCSAPNEVRVSVQLAGLVGTDIEHTLVESSVANTLNLRSNERSDVSVVSIFDLQYVLRYHEKDTQKTAKTSTNPVQSMIATILGRQPKQQQNPKHDYLAQDVLQFGTDVARHSLCLSIEHEYELKLQWADAVKATDAAQEGKELSTRSLGASLCGGKYLVPIGRSFLLSKAVLNDCFASAAVADIQDASIATTKEEDSDEKEGEAERRQLQINEPTSRPTVAPSFACIPTSPPSSIPSSLPTQRPSEPTSLPTQRPSEPTSMPTSMPSLPTSMPSKAPTVDSGDGDQGGGSGNTNSGGGGSGGGNSATQFFSSDEGYGTIAAAGVVGLGLIATGVYFLLQYTGDLVKAPLAPQELAMQI